MSASSSTNQRWINTSRKCQQCLNHRFLVFHGSALSLDPRPKVFVGGTLFDGTGLPPVRNSVIVIEGERIVAVGERGQIEIPEVTEIIDLTGKTVIPGLIDAHIHFLEMEMMIRTVDLNETKSIKEAKNEIMGKLSQTKKGEWVLGRGWDISKWEDRRYISKWDLGPFSPDHLIVLTRVCGHMITLNS